MEVHIYNTLWMNPDVIRLSCSLNIFQNQQRKESYTSRKSTTSETSQAHPLCFVLLQNIAMLSGKR
jgi:hypothetical protein